MRDKVEEMIAEISISRERMFDEFYIKIDAIYFPLNNIIGWLNKCMEEL